VDVQIGGEELHAFRGFKKGGPSLLGDHGLTYKKGEEKEYFFHMYSH
jgi:hypothetical protein